MYENEDLLYVNRYAKSFNIAERAIETANAIRNLSGSDLTLSRIFNKFHIDDYPIIAVPYAIQSIDQLVNHLGFIFHDDWKDYGKFKKQYDLVSLFLSKHNIAHPNFIENYYPSFMDIRERIRHPIIHPRPSIHSGSHSIKKSETPTSHEEFGKVAVAFLDKWPNVNLDEANKVVQSCKNVISGIMEELKFSLIEIENPLKKQLLDHFIVFPFDEKEILTGSTSVL